MKKASGFIRWRPFEKGTRHRTNATNVAHDLQHDQRLVMSGWSAGTNRRVDTERVNWKGILFMQQEAGLFDPRIRIRRPRRAQ